MPLLEKFKGDLTLEWEIIRYTKDIDNVVFEPEVINEDEFMDIMQR